MARGPATIVDASSGVRLVTRPTAIPTPRRARVTEAMVGSPSSLARYLSEEERLVDGAYALAGRNIFASGVLFKNVAMTAGASVLVEHRLGRAYSGWVLTRVRAASAVYPIVIETTLPTGRDASQWLQLEASQLCTLDVLVF